MYVESFNCHIFLEYKFAQDMKKCSPEGRNCFESMSSYTFNCSTACEGIYADVENIEEDLEEEDEIGNELVGVAAQVYKTLKKEIEMMKGRISKNGDELDRNKYMKLISEYKQFKKNEVQHFRFNSAAAHAATFGRL